MPYNLRDVSYRYQRPSEGPVQDAAASTPTLGVHVADLSLSAVGVTAIMGKSGSGKTTLLSLLAGFLPAEIGPNGFFKFNWQPYGDDLISGGRIGFVFQNPMLLGAATGLVNLMQGSVATGGRVEQEELTAQQVLDRLHQLDLYDENKGLLAKRARSFSGGEAQRFAVLRAILRDPDVILCDEPTSSLDQVNADRVMKTLKRWAATRERAVIWVTHGIEQAAEHADDFKFVIDGEVYDPDSATIEILTDPERNPVEKADAIRTVLGFEEYVSDSAPGPRAFDPGAEIRVERWRYARWIANALSTDTTRAGRIEKTHSAALVPNSVHRALETIAPSEQARLAWWRLAALRIAAYNRIGLAVILMVLMAQIGAAAFLGMLAHEYATIRLQDPSIARLALEYNLEDDFTLLMRNTGPPPPLTAFQMDDLSQAIRDHLPPGTSDEDTARVRLFARWPVEQSNIRAVPGPEASARCPVWGPAAPTLALEAADPLLNQAQIVPLGTMTDDTLRSTFADSDGAPVALIQHRFLLALERVCDIDLKEPMAVDWAAGEIGKRSPLPLTIIGSFTVPPPVQPTYPAFIVRYEDFESIRNRQNIEVDPPVHANAYIPLDGFEAARTILEGAGYTVRDDSAAAVGQIRRIAGLALTVPPMIVAVNVLACVIVVALVLDSLLELNRRVLALFVAHGFVFADLWLALWLHLVPAVALGVLPLALAVFLWLARQSILAEGGADLRLLGALGFAFACVAICALLTSMGIVRLWWSRTRNNLKSFLQD